MFSPPKFDDPQVQQALLDLVPSEYRQAGVIYVGGSLVEGYGNQRSDIDVTVLTDELASASSNEAGMIFAVDADTEIHIGEYAGLRVDLEVIRLSSFMTLRDELMVSHTMTEGLTRNKTMLNNLRIGIPLTSPQKFEEIRSSFPWDIYSAAMVRHRSTYYFGSQEDAIGGVESGDVGPMHFSSSNALDSAVECYLASRGCTNFRSKWRLHQMRSLADPRDLEDYESCVVLPSLDRDAVEKQTRARLTLAQRLLTKAHMEIAPAQDKAVAWPRSEQRWTGLPNARSMEGIRVDHGRIGTDVLFRSGAAEGADYRDAQMDGVVSVFDLRTESETTISVRPAGLKLCRVPIGRDDEQGSTIGAVKAIAAAEAPVLVHCVKGRDRTGMVIATILTLLGASVDEVVADYMEGVRGWDRTVGVDRAEEDYNAFENQFVVMTEVHDLERHARGLGVTDEEVGQLRAKFVVADETHPHQSAPSKPASAPQRRWPRNEPEADELMVDRGRRVDG